MNGMKTIWQPLLALALALCFSCTEKDQRPVEASNAAAATEEGHGHEVERSDLDRPVAELLALDCEHNMKTYTCAECRYEAGVSCAPAELFKDGTLRMATVERRMAAQPLELTGELAFDEERVSHVSAVVSGVVRKTLVRLGSRVARGQVLVEVESAEAAEAQESFLQAEAESALVQRESERVEELHRQGIASERELQRGRQELELARLRVETARGRLSWLGMSVDAVRGLKAGDARGLVPLRAPEAGTVLALHAVPGESVHPEESLATVGDSGRLWVWCDLYERDLAPLTGRRAEGMAAELHVQAWPGESFPGRVDFLSPSLDAATRTARLRVAVENDGQRLMAGMFARVKLFLPGDEKVRAVPAAAVLEDEGRAFVFVPVKGDYFVRRAVRPGRRWDGWVELLGAPDSLDRVVGEGAFLLKSDVLRSKMGAGCAD